MARYIDADKLIAHLKDEIEGCKPPFGGRANGKSIAYGTVLGLKSAISFAETLSTADVVPKSEVDLYNRLYHEVEDELQETYNKLENAKAEVAREIFEEIERLLREHSDWEILCDGKSLWYYEESLGKDIAELKKKYQGGELNG